jgi:TonB-linked SusC/RagA family outer membrane protein
MRKEMLFRAIAMLFAMCLSYSAVMAQNRFISGAVSDQHNGPLANATVAVKGSKAKTITDASGAFKISVPVSAKSLTITYVGASPVEVSIENKTSVTVTLEVTDTKLSEVVVIGYGTQRRRDINGAISSVTSKELANIPQPTVDQMLQGRAAGVTVTANSGQPGSSISVRIRGITSFSASEPLYVIDGVVIDGNAPSQASTNDGIFGGLSPSTQEQKPSVLASINPNDIESIDVLKDASATAIYGSRGANGVIIITTKKGKLGDAKINYDGYLGFQEQGQFMDVMNLSQYAKFQNTLADLFRTTKRIEFADPSKLGPGTDWQDAVFRRATQSNHTLSISGANARTDYYVSGGYYQQDGTIIGSDFKRYSLHTSINSQVKDWFKVGTSITANQNKANTVLGNNYGIIYSAILQAPDVPVYNADGSFAGPSLDAGGQPMGRLNPLQRALTVTNYLMRSNIQGRIYGDIKFLKDFVLHSEIDGSFNWGQAKIFNPTYSYGAPGAPPAFANTLAVLEEANNFDTYWNWLEHLNYNHVFGGKHAVSALLGREVWQSTYGGIIASTKGFTAGNTIQTLNLGTQSTNTLNEPKGSTSMESYLARVIYTFNNKYSVTANIRRDRSSNFAEGHQVGYFPGAAASWKVSEEPFMANMKTTISSLKIRAGYGTTGNSSIPQYSYGSAIFPVVTGMGTGFRVGNFSNPDLTWQKSIQQNIGLDIGILNNRITASFDVYKKTSKDFLFQQPLPSFLGGGTAEYSGVAVVQPPWVNAGEIENTGFEFTINSQNIKKKDFTWSSTVIFSHYKNKVISLNGFPELNGVISTGFGPQIFATKTRPGGSVGEFYGYKVMGIISTQAQLTYLLQNPQNVLGAPQPISSDRSLSNAIYLGDIQYDGNDGKGGPNKQYSLGSPNPDFTYSISNDFTYKNFDLSIFLTGSQGGKILNALSFQTQGMYGLYMNQRTEAANFWTTENPNSKIPAPRASWGNNNLVMSDRFLESASYLRIQNVRLGYNLPANWAGKVKMTRLRVYFSGQNLHVFSKYSGLDPEVGSLNQNPILQNIDYGRYPTPRTLTFGINAEF